KKVISRVLRSAPRSAPAGLRARGTGRGSTIAVVERLGAIFAVLHGGRAGYMRQVRVSTYGLGPLLIQLGATAVGALRVVNLGENYLQRLVEEGGETGGMSIWGGHRPVGVRG